MINHVIETEKVVRFYKDDFVDEILKVQLKTVKSIFMTVTDDRFERLHCVTKIVTIYFNDYIKLLKLMIVIPATNGESERSFSAMRRLLTYLRSSISDNRLNNSMVLHYIHKEELDNRSLIDIENNFVDGNECRKSMLGMFKQTDIRKSSV